MACLANANRTEIHGKHVEATGGRRDRTAGARKKTSSRTSGSPIACEPKGESRGVAYVENGRLLAAWILKLPDR